MNLLNQITLFYIDKKQSNEIFEKLELQINFQFLKCYVFKKKLKGIKFICNFIDKVTSRNSLNT